jgi:membrane protein required for colicin V production
VTLFDFIAIGVVGLATLLSLTRGFVREVVSLASWIAAALAGIHLSRAVGAMLPEIGGTPAARYLVAFALIAIAVLIVGALLGLLLSRLVRAVGLGPLDRLLGAVLGVAQGLVMLVIAVLVAGLTTLPRQDWWQNALFAPPLVAAALSLRPWLPLPWAEQLDYGRTERPPARTPPARVGA